MESPVPSQVDEVGAELGIAFSPTTRTEDLPQNNVVAETLAEAAKNPNNNFNVTFNPNAVSVTDGPVPDAQSTATPGTTTAPPTTAAAPLYTLEAQLFNEAFTDQLNNPNSPQYKDLESRIIKACEDIYQAEFPRKFLKCTVKEFSPVPSQVDEVGAELAIAFSPTTPTEDLPQNNVVAETLAEAAKNPNNNFNVTFNPNAVSVTDGPVPDAQSTATPGTTTAPPPTPTTAAEPLYTVQAQLFNETFTDQLNNPNSPQYKDLESRIKKACKEIYQAKYGKAFSRCIVKKFSPVPSQVDEVGAELGIAFSPTTPTEDLPQNNVVAETLAEAAKNPNNNFNVTFIPNAVSVTDGPVPDAQSTATPGTTTAPPTTAAAPLYTLEAQLFNEAFTDQLNNPNSPQYKDLESRIIKACEDIYQAEFPRKFLKCTVKEFSPVPSQVDEVGAELGIAFSPTTPTEDLPQNNVVAETLAEAAKNPNNNFNVTFNPNAVSVTDGPVPDAQSTATPGTTTAPPPTPTTAAEPLYTVQAQLFNETFTDQLNNPNSSQYKDLESRIKKACKEIYQAKYGKAFSRCIVKKFSPVPSQVDEVGAELGIAFSPTTPTEDLPQNNVVAETLAEAAKNPNNNFNVTFNPNAVSVTDGPVPDAQSTATPGTTTAPPTTAAAPLYTLEAQLFNEAFTDQLNNPNSPQYKDLESRIIKACEDIYQAEFPRKFLKCTVKEFSPVPSQVDEVGAELGIAFSPTTPTEDLPPNNVVAETLAEAAKDPNNNFNVTFNPNAVSVTDGPVPDAQSTATPGTTTAPPPTPTTAAEPLYTVQAQLFNETFTDQLNNPNSPQYKDLESRIKKACKEIYQAKYGKAFSRCIVKKFSPVPSQVDEVGAELGIAFSPTTPTEDLPQNNVVAETLAEAAKNPNNNFNVTFNPNAVSVTDGPVPDAQSTATPGTTTAPPTTAAAPLYTLEAQLFNEAFTDQLNNPNSPQYKDLESRIIKACEDIYQAEFPSKFLKCTVKEFSPVPSQVDEVGAELAIAFSPTTPTEDLPQNNVVAETLAEAAKNPNNNFNVTFNPNAVSVTDGPVPDAQSTATPGTTTAPPPTPTTAAEPLYTVQAQLFNETFTDQLNNPNSSQYKDLESRIKKACKEIYQAKYGKAFSRCIVKKFSPVPSQVDEVGAELGIAFSPTTPTEDLPQNNVVAETLAEAAKNPNNNFNVTFNPNAVSVTDGPVPDAQSTATPGTTTAPPPTAAAPLYTLEAQLFNETFTDQLNNPNSPQYKDLEERIIKACEDIYQAEFPSKFLKCTVKEFSPVPSQVDEVGAELAIAFSPTTPTEDLPQNNVVAETLAEAAKNPNNNFNVTFNPNAVSVTDGPVPDAQSTATPGTTTAPPPTPTTAAEPLYTVQAQLFNETFTDQLNNPNSPQYKDLESRIKKSCKEIYQAKYGKAFSRCIVKKFSPITTRTEGVIADLAIAFAGTTPTAELPKNNDVAETLVRAASDTNSNFDVSFNPVSVALIDGPVPDAQSTAAPAITAPGATTAAPASTTAAPATSAAVATTAAPATAAPAATTAAPATAAPAATTPAPATAAPGATTAAPATAAPAPATTAPAATTPICSSKFYK
ncbi:flocculation protein FLO11-like [Notolabrus celidotus]|uniref:flocculation protein FLO11-like n=1 Tax=Notolabrus celidotus TaxID=1203425 RepID=UPI00148F7836|nr:flocculation protein FLO11-like [Notolabrus celidotus]